MSWRLEGIVVLQQCQCHAGNRHPLAARRIVHLRNVFRDGVAIQERRDRNRFLGFLVDHDGHADAAVGVAAAAQRSPVLVGPVNQVGPIREGAHKRNREPVAGGLAQASLVLHIVRQMRQGVALRLPAFVGDGLIASGKRNRLEREERDALGIVERELDDASHLLVVQVVDDGDDGHDLDACVVQVLDRLQLHVKQIADQAMRIGGVTDAVELQIRVAQTRFKRLLGKLGTLGKLDAVGRRLHAVVANLARVSHRVEEVGRQRGFAAGELY